ncbi:MAG: sugar ABC transporter substrate-binding protein, partial [Candidatus Methylomirabilales bacterium]
MRKLVTLLLSATAVTAACTGTTSSEQSTGRGVSGELSFLVFGEPEELKAYRNVIRSFRSIEPDVDITLIVASDRDDLLARLSTSFAGGSPPDLFLLNYRFYGQFAVREVLEAVEPRLEASTAFEPEDFYPEAME